MKIFQKSLLLSSPISLLFVGSEIYKMDRILLESKDSVTCPICADVFDDPRTLSCSHCFCLHCLIEFRGPEAGTNNKFCPVCRENTVPPIGQIQTLPRNDFAEKVAKLIRETETPNIQPTAPPGMCNQNYLITKLSPTSVSDVD